MQPLLFQIALTQVPQIGAVTAKILVSYCGSAEAVFRAKPRELQKIPGIGAVVIERLKAADPMALAEKEIHFLEQQGIEALFYTDDRFPARLKQCYDCPAMLYFKGSSSELLSAQRIVGIVGTRQPTEWGRSICEEMVEGLKAYGVVIVSGLAYGVDVTAHRKAVASGIPNIGVLGHGLANIYPADHRATAYKMIENGGLLSEYTHNTKPDRENFPMRNRIIAGLCDALIVVETGQSGGSMISAELAAQYEREVFAIPGRPCDPKSAGCNLLIKTEKARLMESVADLAAIMRWAPLGKGQPVQTALLLDLEPNETKVLGLVRQSPEISIDHLTALSGLSPGELAALILGLEFKGALKTLPGKRYMAL